MILFAKSNVPFRLFPMAAIVRSIRCKYWRQILSLLLCLALVSIQLQAQEEEDTIAKAATLTPFTGVNYVRVVFDAKEAIAGARYHVVIRSLPARKIFWEGEVKPAIAVNEGGQHRAFTISNLHPLLWTPAHPNLYEIELKLFVKNTARQTFTERLGFRSFERRGGNLFLNGKPIFLRGIAINPPGRGIPRAVEESRAFALDYVRFMKSINVNIIRIPDAEAWYDVCDELGMMVFGGNYSGKVAGGEKVNAQAKLGDETDGGFPSDYDRGVDWYENKKLGGIAHHPSLMVYAVTNETPFAGPRAALWEKFLSYAYDKLKKWDETRVYIANAGYGYGKSGDITDIHRYWGWYYSSPFTFLHIRNEAEINPYPSKNQPITFTECVGNYTGPDGRYNLTPGHKNPSSQLAWTGHERQDLQAELADYHQSFTFRQATETFRQLREVNPNLSGVFPFTILFYNWNTITRFDDMNPKPVTDQVKLSYQPVLLSWECWTPNVFAGSTLQPIAHLINDDNDFKDVQNVKLVYELKDKAQAIVYSDSIDIGTIPYYKAMSKKISFTIPVGLVTGNYQLSGRLLSSDSIVSSNVCPVFIADKFYTAAARNSTKPVLLYDNAGITRQAFEALQIPYTLLTSAATFSANDVLVIGENAADAALLSDPSLKKMIGGGGRVVIMRQDSVHLNNVNSILNSKLSNFTVDIDDPAYPLSAKSPRNGYYLNPERADHPLFAGITRGNLRVWSDYNHWDETKPGFPAIKPVTDGFTFTDKDEVASTAILANYSSGLQGVAVAEQFQGGGSILLCGLDIVHRVSVDPVAARFLLNMIAYSSGPAEHERYPLVTAPIIWGEYETEKGLVTDLYSGMLVNSTPRVGPGYMGKGIVVTKDGYQLAGGSVSGFNTRPGIQYVANGRRPFGPFAQSFGGQPQPDRTTMEGTGQFWCRVPSGKNRVVNVIWNPSKEPLNVRIKVNAAETSETIAAGQKLAIGSPVDNTDVHIKFTGDRRLVILETVFSRQ